MEFFTPLCLFHVLLFVGGVNCFSAKIAFHEIEEVMFSRAGVFVMWPKVFNLHNRTSGSLRLLDATPMYGTPPSTFGRLAYALAMTCCNT